MKRLSLFTLFSCLFFYCSQSQIQPSSPPGDTKLLYLGADLSYVNEMEDCGGSYRLNGQPKDPFQLFAEKKANLVRVRLWHNPTWTQYSNLTDVKKTIRRAKNAGMEVLLDFHYSDDWADPGDQIIPAAWSAISDVQLLADSLYNYTLHTLLELNREGLLPELVQVGNETNTELLLQASVTEGQQINWNRNIILFNKGLDAVKKAASMSGKAIQTVIHIAQPENALWWFKEAFQNKIGNFDWIGLSYYPKWSSYPLNALPKALDSLKKTYQKRIMIVETAYPYGLQNADGANNILGQDALLQGFAASPQGQKNYLITLTKKVMEGGGEGVIYWEPAWISTSCSTRWGQGSHWDNATFFDAQNNNEALPAFDFFNRELYK